MKKARMHNRIWSLLLTLAMVFTMTLATLPAYAAAGGNISVVYNPGVDGLESTNFKLYKVADYGRDAYGTSKVVLESWAKNSGVDLNSITPPASDATDAQKSKWQQDWLDIAGSLANWMETTGKDSVPKTADWSGSLKAQDGAQSLGSHAGGIYILIGEEQQAGDLFWKPVPVLMQVLNGDTTFTINDATLKMTSRAAVYKHTVTKLWDDKGKENARPNSVKIGLYYGNGDDAEQRDIVTLGEKGDGYMGWSYTWYTTEVTTKNDDGSETKKVTYTSKDPKDSSSEGVETAKLNEENKYSMEFTAGASTWSVGELRDSDDDKANLRYYTSKVDVISPAEAGTSDAAESFNITNTFKTAELKITKNLNSYVSQGDANTTVVFDIEGKIGDNVVYKNSVGMAFTGKGTQTFTVENVPYSLDNITVKEVYSTNYKATSPAGGEMTITDPTISEDGTKTYEVSFTNEYAKIENPPTYNSGIVNEYNKSGEYTPKTETSSNTNSANSGSENGSQE